MTDEKKLLKMKQFLRVFVPPTRAPHLQVLTQLGWTTVVPRHDHQLGLRRTIHARLHPQSTHKFSTSNTTHPSASTVPPRQTNLWRKSPIHGRCRLILASQQTGQKIGPRGHRHFALLNTRCQKHHATGTMIPHHTTGGSNSKHQKVGQSISRLRRHTSRRHHHKSSKWHGTRRPQRCILLIGEQRMKQGRRTFSHVQRRHNS